MSADRVLHHVQKDDRKPVALIDGDLQFTGYFLARVLEGQNCQTVSLKQISKKKVRKIDYVFSLQETDLKRIKKLSTMAEKFNARLLLALPEKEVVEKSLQDFLQTKKIDWRIVRLGYIYGPRMNFNQYQELVQLIKVVKVRPLFVADVVYGLIKAMFGVRTARKTFDLNKKTSLNWRPKVSLEEGLKQTEKFFSQGKKTSDQLKLHGLTSTGSFSAFRRSESPPKRKVSLSIPGLTSDDFREGGLKSQKKIQPKAAVAFRRRWALAAVTVFVLILLLLSPFLSLCFYGLMGTRGLRKIQKIAVSDFEKTIVTAQISGRYFQQANRRLAQLSGFLNYFDQGRTTARAQKMFDLGIQTTRAVIYGARAAEQGSDLLRLITAVPASRVTDSLYGDPSAVEKLLTEIKSNLQVVHNQLSLTQATIKSNPGLLQFSQLLGLGDPVKVLVEKLPEARDLVLQAKKGIELVPGLTGLYKKQVYLVLLQNNMELRPTGGFIGSYALLTFDQGRLLDFEVHDVYAADGQLKGHVEPPENLKEHLGEAGWYLRDSNWDPDFPTSAMRAAWFLEKEIGQTVDGVLGVNLFLVQRLLWAVGEISLPDYQEKINADNLFERAEHHAEIGFFPGSTQKQDFLASLTKALFEKMKTVDQSASLKIAKALFQSLREKDVLIYLNDPETMTMIADFGWDGGMSSVRCQVSGANPSSTESRRGRECLVDYLMVVDSNVGVNKANYFVQRKLSHQVQIGMKGEVGEKLKISYRNESQTDIFPAGRYKNYLRVYVPLGSRLEKVTIRNPLTSKVEEIGKDKWELGEEHGKSVFGFLVEVPIRGERIVEIDYQLAEKIPPKARTQYLLLAQKQSGIEDKRFDFYFIPSQGMTAIPTNPKTPLVAGAMAFSPPFNQDLVFEIQVMR